MLRKSARGLGQRSNMLLRGMCRNTRLYTLWSRNLTSGRPQPSSQYLNGPGLKQENMTNELVSYLDSAVRVDQAGEVAANWIYKGQMAVLGRDREAGPLIQEMWDQEKKHLQVMNRLQHEVGARPTVLWGVAQVAGFGLGAVTALMGKEAAMACTEAVETAIGEHYDDQMRDLDAFTGEGAMVPQLKSIITELRDDELEHLDTAVQHHSQRAPAHALLSSVIGAGCKIAIELCKRI